MTKSNPSGTQVAIKLNLLNYPPHCCSRPRNFHVEKTLHCREIFTKRPQPKPPSSLSPDNKKRRWWNSCCTWSCARCVLWWRFVDSRERFVASQGEFTAELEPVVGARSLAETHHVTLVRRSLFPVVTCLHTRAVFPRVILKETAVFRVAFERNAMTFFAVPTPPSGLLNRDQNALANFN